MDCYIVRVYRRIASRDGQDGEIAGLVERVGDTGASSAFSSYKGLLSRLREQPVPEQPEVSGEIKIPTGATVNGVTGKANG